MAQASQPSSAGKWITGLSPGTTVADAARLVLAARLCAVDVSALLAAEAVTDPEAVHQLRVATRRARAALAVFADYVPRKATRRARKTLRKLRRAAGAVRDLDVLFAAINELSSRGAASDPAGGSFLSGYLFARQSAEREQLARTLRRVLDGKSLDRLLKVTTRVRGGDEVALASRATAALDEILTRFTVALDDTAADDRLHQVRIVGKELRYALELFVDCYDVSVRDEVYSAVEKLQDILGDANDARQAMRLIEGLKDELTATRPDLDRQFGRHFKALAAALNKRLAEQRKKLDRWQKQWPGLRAAERLRQPLPAAASDEGGE